jgi:hypothetical protein
MRPEKIIKHCKFSSQQFKVVGWSLLQEIIIYTALHGSPILKVMIVLLGPTAAKSTADYGKAWTQKVKINHDTRNSMQTYPYIQMHIMYAYE